MALLSAHEVEVIVAALAGRAQMFERLASRAGTVTGYEIASRAARRHRSLAARVTAALAAAEPTTEPTAQGGEVR